MPSIRDRSLLRHSGLAQAGKESTLAQSAKIWPEFYGCRETGDAAKTIIITQSSSLGELCHRALGFPFQGIGGGQPGVRAGVFWIGSPRPFDPKDCFCGARLQQMNHANSPVPVSDVGIAWTKTDGLLLSRKRLLY